jgi:acetyl esterase/lipase
MTTPHLDAGGKRFQTASLGLSLTALGAFVAVDWWLPAAGYQLDGSAVPLVGLGAIAHAWTAPLSALAGREFFGASWHLFQPFVGSQVFVLQQALGWTLYALSLLALCYCAVDINGGRHPRGELTLVGVVALMSQVLLNISFLHFSPSTAREQREQRIRRRKQSSASTYLLRSALVKDTWCWISVALTLSATALMLYTDSLFPIAGNGNGKNHHHHHQSFFLIRLSTALHFAAAFVTHVMLGVAKLPGYRIFQPFSGELAFLLLQAFAWLFLGIIADVALLAPSIYKYGITHLGSKMAALGVAAQVLLLASLLYFRTGRRPSDQTKTRLRRQKSSHTTFAAVGWRNWIGMERRHRSLSSVYTFAGAMLLWSAVLIVISVTLIEEDHGNHTLTAAGVVMMLVAAPMGHVGALPMYPGKWRLWQPFDGGAKFAAAQAVGWTCYSISLAMWVVYFVNLVSMVDGELSLSSVFTFEDAVQGLGPLSFLSSWVLCISVLVFDEDALPDSSSSNSSSSSSKTSTRSKKKDVPSAPTPASASSRRKTRTGSRGRALSVPAPLPSPATTSTGMQAWLPEEVLAMLVACVGLCLYLVSDAARLRYFSDKEDVSHITASQYSYWRAPPKLLMALAFLCLSLVVPALVVGAGMRRWPKSFRLWQPFEGGFEFVSWQAFGWTGIASASLSQAILMSVSDPVLQWVGSASSPWMCSLVGGAPAFVSGYVLLASLTKYVPPKDAADTDYLGIASSRLAWTPVRRPEVSTREVSTRKDSSSTKTTSDKVVLSHSSNSSSSSGSGSASSSSVPQVVSGVIAMGSWLLFLAADWLNFRMKRNKFWAKVQNPTTLMILLICGSVSSLVGLAITHVACGPLMHNNVVYDSTRKYSLVPYKVFMPFRGGVPFCLLQGISWFLCGCGVLASLMAGSCGLMNLPFFGILSAIGVVLFFAQILLLLSLYLFDNGRIALEMEMEGGGGGGRGGGGEDKKSPKRKRRRSRSRGRTTTSMLNSMTYSSPNNSMSPVSFKKAAADADFRNALVSGMLCVGSFILFAIADSAILHYGPQFPAGPLIVCGIVAVCASMPLTFYFSPSHLSPEPTKSAFLMTSSSLVGTVGWAVWSFTVMLGFWVLLNLIKTRADAAVATAATVTVGDASAARADANMVEVTPSAKNSNITRWLSIAGIMAQLFLYISVVRPPSMTETIQRRMSYSFGWTNATRSLATRFWLNARHVIRRIGSGKVLFFCVLLATRTYLIAASQTLFVFVETQVGGWMQAVYVAAFFSSVVVFPALHPASIASERLATASYCLWNHTLVWVWNHALRHPTGAIATFAGRVCILPVLRLWLDFPMWLYHYWWFHHGTGHVSQDGLPVRQGVTVSRKHRYGPHPLEELDILSPTVDRSDKVDRGALIFVHGGGWVAVNREVMSQSVTPFVRAGYTVYSIDYPLAPENRFPTPLISVLRATAWIKRRTGDNSLTLVGDSAGGNLATMAAAVLSNQAKLLPMISLAARTSAAAEPAAADETSGIDKAAVRTLLDPLTAPVLTVEQWDFPVVNRVVSMYGVVDSQAWRDPLVPSDGIDTILLQIMWCGTATLLDFCFTCYAPLPGTPTAELTIAKHLTLGDLLVCSGGAEPLEHQCIGIDTYPPTLLICGSADPLVRANRKVQKLLVERLGVSCTLKEFPGPHAFHGIPPQWTLDGWRSNSYPTTRDMIHFLTGGDLSLPEDTIFQPHDWSLPFVLAAHVIIPVISMWQLAELVFEENAW